MLNNEAVSPGPSPSVYAYTKTNSHWNLYRIPIKNF